MYMIVLCGPRKKKTKKQTNKQTNKQTKNKKPGTVESAAIFKNVSAIFFFLI